MLENATRTGRFSIQRNVFWVATELQNSPVSGKIRLWRTIVTLLALLICACTHCNAACWSTGTRVVTHLELACQGR